MQRYNLKKDAEKLVGYLTMLDSAIEQANGHFKRFERTEFPHYMERFIVYDKLADRLENRVKVLTLRLKDRL